MTIKVTFQGDCYHIDTPLIIILCFAFNFTFSLSFIVIDNSLYYLCLVCEKVESKGRTTYNEVSGIVILLISMLILMMFDSLLILYRACAENV